MKTTIPFAVLTALAASGITHAADPVPVYSKPSGYVTEIIKGSGAFNLIGLTLQESTLVSGSFESVNGNQLIDSNVDFDSLLIPGSAYILNFTSGAQIGGVQVVTAWGINSGNAASLVVQDDVGQMGVTNGVSYELRAAATLSSVFGAANEAGLKSGDLLTADVIWLPTGGGGFSKFYYSPGSVFPPIAAGWKNSSGGNATNQAIIYTEGFFIERRAVGDLSLVLTGQVQKAAVQIFAEASKFNYVTSVYPVGTMLGNSGLELTLKSGDLLTGDILWMQNADRSGYQKFYYSAGSVFPPIAAGWKNSSGSDASTQALTSGLIIERRGLSDVAPVITPPSYYSDL